MAKEFSEASTNGCVDCGTMAGEQCTCEISIRFPTEKEMRSVHGGTWLIRYRQAEGKIKKERADKLVKYLRMRRKRM